MTLTLTVPPKVTERAFARLAEINEAASEAKALRVAVDGGGCSGFQYDIRLDDPTEDDIVLEGQGQKVVVDSVSLPFLADAVIDFTEELIGARFNDREPPTPPPPAAAARRFPCDRRFRCDPLAAWLPGRERARLTMERRGNMPREHTGRHDAHRDIQHQRREGADRRALRLAGRSKARRGAPAGDQVRRRGLPPRTAGGSRLQYRNARPEGVQRRRDPVEAAARGHKPRPARR